MRLVSVDILGADMRPTVTDMGNGCYVCTYTLPIEYAEEEEEVEEETRPQTAVAVLGGLGVVRQA